MVLGEPMTPSGATQRSSSSSRGISSSMPVPPDRSGRWRGLDGLLLAHRWCVNLLGGNRIRVVALPQASVRRDRDEPAARPTRKEHHTLTLAISRGQVGQRLTGRASSRPSCGAPLPDFH